MTTADDLVREALALFDGGCSCAEAVAITGMRRLGGFPGNLPKLASGFGGGTCRARSLCGALAGGVLVLGAVHGRERMGDDRAALFAAGKPLVAGFRERFGSDNCYALTGIDFDEPGGMEAYRDHVHAQCRAYVEHVVRQLHAALPRGDAPRSGARALHIGIVACSAEGAALCYRTICAEGAEALGRHAHPEISMHTHPLSEYMERIYEDDWAGVAGLMLSSARKLAACGCELLVSPDNTIHRAFPLVATGSPLPWLHIAEVVADEAQRRGFKHLAILGTRYTMEGPVYSEVLGRRDIAHLAPDAEDRAIVDRVIFDELTAGVVRAKSEELFLGIIARMRARGCDAVVLGCTEIPLLVTPERSPLPTLDSTRLLARAALERATAHTGGET
jgi:aspartate racemase